MSTPPWLPDWYAPGLRIAEDAVRALFAPLFPTDVPGAVEVINQLPDDALGTGWSGRLLYIARFGGAAQLRRDQAAIQFGSITNARNDSLLLDGFVRDMLASLCDDETEVALPGGQVVTIVEVGETNGSEEVPGAEYDERIVTSTHLFTFDIPLETPDYSRYLGIG